MTVCAIDPMQALLDAIARMASPTDAERIFHGRGGLFPGCEHLALDAFPPVFLLTAFAPVTEAELMQTVFPHPTLSEMMHESVLDAYGRALHF